MVRKPNLKNTKAEILEAFNELSKEKSALESQIKQLNKTPAPAPVAPVNAEAKPKVNPPTAMTMQNMNQTIEALGKLQLGFGGAVSSLSEQLTTEASKLQELRSSVAEEIKQLKELHDLETSEDTLPTLVKTYEESAKKFEQEIGEQRETLGQEIQDLKAAWQKEQEDYKRQLKERNETHEKARKRELEQYQYDLELARKLDQDSYAQGKKTHYKDLEEFQQEKEKTWTEQEKAIAEREKQYAEVKEKVEAFPKELEAATKKAKDEGKGIATYQAKIKADLVSKEIEGQKRFYEQRIQSLEETIRNQQSRIQAISQQLDAALKQVQDLAVKAIEGSANANSLQAMREIALEQAKNSQKVK